MFREMRRKKQELSRERCVEILKKGTSGVLALSGDEGYPYALPISYVYDEAAGKLFFHCAKSGHKLDAIRREEKASFCVIERDEICPEKYTTFFRSLILFGRLRIVEDGEKKRQALENLGRKYAPHESEAHLSEEIESSFCRLEILVFDIEHMSGKEAIEFVRRRNTEEA